MKIVARYIFLITSFFLSLLIFSDALATAPVCQSKFPGVNLVCGQGTIINLPDGSYGTVKLGGTKVTGTANLNTGTFSATNSFIATAALNAGKTSLISTTVNTGVFTTGSLTAESTSFKNNIVFHCPNISFNKVNSKSLTIIDDKPTKVLRLTLNNGSVVNGDISFSNNNGRVCLEGGSLLNGKIIGGKRSCS